MDKKLLTIGKTAKMVGVSIDTLRRWDKSGKFSSLRVTPGGNRYYRKSDVDQLINDPAAAAKNWAVAATPLEPAPDDYCKTRDIFQARLERFRDELAKQSDVNTASLLTAISGEIGNNSFDHNLGNWPDILGVFFSYSLSQKKIVLADRGLGILTTLKRVKPGLHDHSEALKTAFTQTLSGRAPESRGNGLKFVRNVIAHNPFKIIFQTGNAVLHLKEGSVAVNIEISENKIQGCLAIIEY